MDANSPYAVIEEFEARMAEYSGAPYAVAVDTCTAALFLSLEYTHRQWNLTHSWPKNIEAVDVPARTYCSVPGAVLHAGFRPRIVDVEWRRWYFLDPTAVVDAAIGLRRRMYLPKTYTCLSFQYRKHLPIGRGGMILTDSVEARDWFRLARFNGREALPVGAGRVVFPGWHLFLEPERAARGLTLLQWLPDEPPDLHPAYPDLRFEPAYQEYADFAA